MKKFWVVVDADGDSVGSSTYDTLADARSAAEQASVENGSEYAVCEAVCFCQTTVKWADCTTAAANEQPA